MSNKKLQMEKYLKQRVNPILEPLTLDIIKSKPQDVYTFCRQWFQKPYQNKSKIRQITQVSDNQEDVVDDEILKKKISKIGKRNRSGVSAEVYGEFNRKSHFQPKVIPKSQETNIRILILMHKSILFMNLDDRDAKIVAGAMEEKNFKNGQFVIKEGQDGDALYMVDQGQFDCFKKINGVQTYLKTYNVGQAFGQLALLYNAPRAASIKAKTDGKLFVLDRNTFNHIVKQAAIKKKKLYEDTLRKVQLLDCIGTYQRSQISDALKQSKYNPGEYIIRQGDLGDKFYIVVEGKLIAQRKQKNQQTKIVYHYKQGDYFGEIALVRNIPRQASIKTLTYCKIVSIERSAFKRILGPIQQILKRNQQRYKKFWSCPIETN